jgi:glycerol-3-phosphate O-acyltransferase
MQPAAEVRTAPEAIADRLSAMTPRFNAFFRWFGRRFLRHLELDPDTVATLRSLESRGAVVYVMRYPSRLDYFLFNWLFLQNGLRLSGFANGLAFYYYGPLLQALARAAGRLAGWLRGGAAAAGHEAGREHVHELVRAGESLFLFLRTERALRPRRAARERHELDLVGELVGSVWNDDRPVFLVPLALFWRKGPRHARRFLNLGYGGPTRPTDLAKVTGFLLNYRNLKIKVGEPIDLRAFVAARRAEGAATLARKVRRSLLLHLYREEKVVEGPPIQPLHRVEEEIFADPEFEAALAGWARAHDRDVEAARAQAREILAEIAASMNSTFLAVLNLVVSSIIKRMFAGVEVSGLEKVADYARQNPIVLVPSHRSYFDFLVLSWLFYGHHMVPPHIAARENMAFGPFGFVFRRAGAFFLRRSFDDPLYKEVFRRYVGYLVREGFTQEFFIEGGRSRTGKTLAPKFGYLGWVVDAFLAGARRDLFFIPTAITYERLVEEGALVRELEGGEKQSESVLGLVRARKFLQRRFGTIFVSFGEPISLAQAVGARRELLARDDPEAQEERRRFVEQLGNRLVERINWATVANATCVAACALLGHPRRGLLRAELVQRMQSIVELLHIQDVRLTPALVADEGEFRESIAFLLRSDLLRAMPDPRGEILFYEEGKRRALDLYRNGIIHFLATPSFLARALLAGGSAEHLRAEVAGWLELLYQEFFAPREELLAAHVDGFLDYFERRGVVERSDDQLRASEKGRAYLRFVAAQTRGVIEGYYATCTAALDVAATPVSARALLRSVREQFQRGELLGEIRRPEGGNPVTFQNALDFLVRRGVLLQQREPGERRREVCYLRGPAADELPALRERLAAALLAG